MYFSNIHRELMLGIALGAVAIATPSATAQSNAAENFLSRATSNSDFIACDLVALSTSNNNRVADDFIARPKRHDMSIFQIAGLNLITNAGADNTLSVASGLLQSSTAGGDVTCCIEMRRTGAVGNIAAPASVIGGVVTTTAAYNTLASATGDARGDVMVVAGLTICGGTVGNFNGCAGSNDAMFMNINTALNSTWAHEFGHVQALGHRPLVAASCAVAGNGNLMFPRGCAGRAIINAAECSAYQSNSQD